MTLPPDEIRALAIAARAASKNWERENPLDVDAAAFMTGIAADERSLLAWSAAVRAVIALMPAAPELAAKQKQINEALDAAAKPQVFVAAFDQDPPLVLGEISRPVGQHRVIFALEQVGAAIRPLSTVEQVRVLRAALILVGE